MQKSSLKTTISAIFTTGALLCSACFAAGAATVDKGVADSDDVTINVMTQKQDEYNVFNSAKTISQSTVNAKAGDLIEVTVYAQSNDPDFTMFCNGQCMTVFSTGLTDGESIFTADDGILSYYDEYYTDEDDEHIRFNINPKLPSVITNSQYRDYNNLLFFNFTSPENILNFKDRTKLYSFVVKANKAGTTNIITGDYYIGACDAEDELKYIENKADLYTEAKVIKDEPEPVPGETKIGDVNGDGVVNGKDSALLMRFTSGWEGYESKINKDAADINGDGTINGKDSAILMRYTSGWEGYDKYFN